MHDPRGCRAHGVLAEDVVQRWDDAERICKEAADGDDAEFHTQADRIGMCICCFGPTLDLDTSLCSECFAF